MGDGWSVYGGEAEEGAGPARFMIATPGQPRPAMLRSLMGLVKPPGCVYNEGDRMTPGRAKMNIAQARNALVDDFMTAHETGRFGPLKVPLNWLFMVDGDAVLHPGTMHRLQGWNKAVVGALAFTRYAPYQPVVYRGVATEKAADMRSYWIQYDEVMEWLMAHPELLQKRGAAMLAEAPQDALHEVDWTGTHCFLVHRSVFEKVERPWFVMASKVKYGSGSDRLFFEKVKAAGFTVNVDYSVIAGHEAEVVVGAADFMAWMAISTREEQGAGSKEQGIEGDGWVELALEGEGSHELHESIELKEGGAG